MYMCIAINGVMRLMFAGDHHPMEQTQYGSNITISETSNEASGSYVAASDYPTPLESVSVSMMQPEQVILSEPVTQEPDDARTPHQLVIM